jgi:adenosylcobyric acid synthase
MVGTKGGQRGGLMVCGTTSDAGKSTLVTALCRLLARRGVRVAPFKAQNMALNSYVTVSGHEIGRAQAAQAHAAGVEPEVAMNPVLLKPTGDQASQVVVQGRPWATLSAAEYHERKPELLGVVLDSLADLRARFDVVIAEGAGSPTEINLLDRDIVNLPIAVAASLPALVVGDIERGGVFASLYGTVMLLPPDQRARVKGFVINKFRGDPALLGDGCERLEALTGVPTLGILPWTSDLGLDAEDSLALDQPYVARPACADALDVAVIRFPRIANFTDIDPLAIEPGVSVRLVTTPAGLGDPDLIVLPGTKATVDDLAWLRATGLDRAIEASRALVLGLCGGLQMMGRVIVDHVESGMGKVEGVGWVDVETGFGRDKVVRQRRGVAMGEQVAGYQIHHGVVTAGPASPGFVHLDDDVGCDDDGAVALDGARFLGTTLHGLFESDAFRATFLTEVGRRADKTFVPAGVSFAQARQRRFDRIADLVAAHVDLTAVDTLIFSGTSA